MNTIQLGRETTQLKRGMWLNSVIVGQTRRTIDVAVLHLLLDSFDADLHLDVGIGRELARPFQQSWDFREPVFRLEHGQDLLVRDFRGRVAEPQLFMNDLDAVVCNQTEQ